MKSVSDERDQEDAAKAFDVEEASFLAKMKAKIRRDDEDLFGNSLSAETERRKWFLVTMVCGGFVLLPSLGFGFGYDHGFFHYSAWATLNGRWPYADTWDTPTPVVLFFHLLAILFSGESPFAFRVLDCVIQLACLTVIFKLSSALASPRAGAISAVLYAILYVGGTYYHTGQRDSFIAPLLLIGVWYVWKYVDRPRGLTIAVTGLAWGIAYLIRPTYGLLTLVVVIYLLVNSRLRTYPLRRRIRDVILLSFLSGLPMLVFLGVYAWAGKLKPLQDLATFMSDVYPHIERLDPFTVLMTGYYPPTEILWLGALASLLSRASKVSLFRYGSLVALALLCILIRLIESKGYHYQWWPLFACAAVLSGIGWDSIIGALVKAGTWSDRFGKRVAIVATAAIVVLAGMSTQNLLRAYLYFLPGLRASAESPPYASLLDRPDQAKAAKYVRDNSQPGDLIQTWGTFPMFYFASNRLAASRFAYTAAFICNDGVTKFFSECSVNNAPSLQTSLKNEFLEAVNVRKPKYIVAHYENGSLAVEDVQSFAPDFPELRTIIDRDYSAEITFGLWSVFRRRGQ